VPISGPCSVLQAFTSGDSEKKVTQRPPEDSSHVGLNFSSSVPERMRPKESPWSARMIRCWPSTARPVPSPDRSTPVPGLDACHLDKCSEVGVHIDEGGPLLRRDLHRLFDEGLIVVDASATIRVAGPIRSYSPMASCTEGCEDEPDSKAAGVLKDHWTQWSSGPALVLMRLYETDLSATFALQPQA
jgi:hypothetical protein